MTMNSENWLQLATKGKATPTETTSADRRREMPNWLRTCADEAEHTNNPVLIALTPAAARRLADDVELAAALYPEGVCLAASRQEDAA
jgi:hypothetical protein